MRVLLDNNVDHRFAQLLPEHEVAHVQSLGWDRLRNGELLSAAIQGGYEVLITADKQMRHQQNLEGVRLAIFILGSLLITLRHIAPLADQVNLELKEPQFGTFTEISPQP